MRDVEARCVLGNKMNVPDSSFFGGLGDQPVTEDRFSFIIV